MEKIKNPMYKKHRKPINSRPHVLKVIIGVKNMSKMDSGENGVR